MEVGTLTVRVYLTYVSEEKKEIVGTTMLMLGMDVNLYEAKSILYR